MKTYRIETIHSPNGGRVLGVALRRHGRTVDSIQVNGGLGKQSGAAEVAAFWELRRRAAALGATHVRILDRREEVMK